MLGNGFWTHTHSSLPIIATWCVTKDLYATDYLICCGCTSPLRISTISENHGVLSSYVAEKKISKNKAKMQHFATYGHSF